MTSFSESQRVKALFWLSLFHLLVITSSNYLVQLPISIFGFHTTWGAFSFPFIFLATDLTVRIFGAPLARRIIFAVMLPALFISYVVSSLFYMGSWQGFEALTHFNLFVARIAAASFMAYALGQILDVHVFNRLRQNHRWWMAPTASTLFGNVSDTLAFFFIAFWHSPDAFIRDAVQFVPCDFYIPKLLRRSLFVGPHGPVGPAAAKPGHLQAFAASGQTHGLAESRILGLHDPQLDLMLLQIGAFGFFVGQNLALDEPDAVFDAALLLPGLVQGVPVAIVHNAALVVILEFLKLGFGVLRRVHA